jgi:hypothetical protein
VIGQDPFSAVVLNVDHAAQLAHAMGNTLSASNALFATYLPVNVTSLRAVMTARRAGRARLR